MKKFIAFLNYRAGSTVFQVMCNRIPHFLEKTSIKDEPEFRYLPVLPQKSCLYKHVGCGELYKEAAKDHNKPILIATHIGNWWGNLCSDKVPLPYGDPSPMKWGVAEIQKLAPAEWKFINLIRDGRNQIESLCKLKGGIEERFVAKNAEDYFKANCKAFRNKARIVLDCQNQLSNYRIIKFEDLMTEPVDTIVKIFSFFELETEVEVCRVKAQQIKSRKVGPNHTSFKGQDDKMHHRWGNWTSKEKNYFKEVAGKELIELGYEKDNNW